MTYKNIFKILTDCFPDLDGCIFMHPKYLFSFFKRELDRTEVIAIIVTL